jgi:thiol:disulfide interchange protein
MRAGSLQRGIAILTVAILLGAQPAPAQQAQFGAPKTRPGDSLFGPATGSEKGVVAVESQFTAPAAGKPGRLFITAKIEPGWHIYSITQPAGGPIVTKIAVHPPPGVRLAGEFRPTVEPEKKKEPAFDNLTVESHQGTVTWYAPIELAAGVDPATLNIPGKITVQPCDVDSCLPPEALPFSAAVGPGIAVPSEAPTPTVPFDLGAVLVQLAWAFLGGLILNLMPCVLPVISLKILAFVEQAGESRGRVFALNVWYSLGLLAVFMVLAALAATAGLAWGEQFTLPWFKVAMTGFVFVMALSFLGVWEIPIPGFVGTGRANELQSKEGPSGAFFKGVFTTILATPCSGPFLGPVFGYLLKQPPYMAYWVFGAVGLGMASPYLLIGAFPELIRFLPRPGVWMETFQQFMGFLLLATVVYLFNTLSVIYFLPTLTLLMGLWFACWWIGRTPLTAAPHWRAAAWCGGSAVAALVGFFAFTVLMQESRIPWQPFSPEALARARAEGKTVMVDFTANWCPNCKTNSKLAIETEAVAELVKANGVAPLLADWTDKSPMIKKALNDLGYNSIPVLAIWPASPSQQEPIVLADLLTEGQVLDALNKAGPSKPR